MHPRRSDSNNPYNGIHQDRTLGRRWVRGRSNSNNPYNGILLGWICIAVGLGILGWVSYYVACVLDTQGWEETSAKIIAVDWVCLGAGRKGPTREYPTARYEYTYRGKQYTGDLVSIDDGHYGMYLELSKHQESRASFRCYVNPADPSESILYRDLRTKDLAFMAISAIMFGGGGAVCVRTARAQLARHRTQMARGRSNRVPP